jgi:hypothetical protein
VGLSGYHIHENNVIEAESIESARRGARCA